MRQADASGTAGSLSILANVARVFDFGMSAVRQAGWIGLTNLQSFQNIIYGNKVLLFFELCANCTKEENERKICRNKRRKKTIVIHM